MSVIRRATVDDASEIARVKIIGWETTYGPLVPAGILAPMLDAEKQTAYLSGIIQESAIPALVAEDSAEVIIGLAVSYMTDEPYLESLHVLPQYRGERTGEQLIRALAGELLVARHETLTLWVLEGNTRAQAFYRRLGGSHVRTEPVDWTNGLVNGFLFRWDDLPTLAESAR